MTKREIIRLVLEGKKPPYTPWSFTFTVEAAEKLQKYYGTEDIERPLDNHILGLGCDIGLFNDLGNGIFQDHFGVRWNRTVDKDIGIPVEVILKEPTLTGFEFPDPLDRRFFSDIEEKIEIYPDRFRLFRLGFSLFERAWTLRGMENLMMDFLLHPDFVHQLFQRITDYNLAQVRYACRYDIDAVYFGDDWGQQTGLIMGPKHWRNFIKPYLEKMYRTVRQELGKYQFIHSCGKVDSLFDDLISIGLNCFNPFQPEVMDVWSLVPKYRRRLTFHGGLSTQKTLPFGSVEDVRNETRKLLALGSEGGFILSPAHAVESDVPLENMLTFIEESQKQTAGKF